MSARSRRSVARIQSVEQLQRSTVERCRAEFSGFAGREWTERDREYIGGERVHLDDEVERRAVAIHKRLRAAILDAERFVQENPNEGRTAAFELRFLLGLFGPVLPAIRESKTSLRKPWNEGGREGIVKRAWGRDYLGLGRPLTRRELAVVSILCGNFPDVTLPRGGLTVARVIQDEMKALGLAEKQFRRKSGMHDALEWRRRAKRENEIRKNPAKFGLHWSPERINEQLRAERDNAKQTPPSPARLQKS